MTTTHHHTATSTTTTTSRALAWGAAIGVGQAVLALGFWWLELATVHALMVALIAAVYIGFAVGDGRPKIIVTESLVAGTFFVAAAVAVDVTPWLIVALYLAHGAKDLWQHRSRFVRGTRWWPPFCFAVDMAVAAAVALQILLGTQFHT